MDIDFALLSKNNKRQEIRIYMDHANKIWNHNIFFFACGNVAVIIL